jgi:putative transposase
MPRRLRHADGGFVFHVLNRAVGRATLFESHADFAAFEKVLRESVERSGIRLPAYCIMPNHWHMVLWPDRDGQLQSHLQWLTVTHVRRWHTFHGTVGTGPISQGRYKSFPIQEDDHIATVIRYVERNPVRANLVDRAESWRWSSLWHRGQPAVVPWLAAGPIPLPDRWPDRVNRPETEAELTALRRSATRGQPYGHTTWQTQTALRLGLESTTRMRGRPKKVL